MPQKNSIKSWLLAARPKTLPAAIVPVWVGSLPVLFGDGGFSWLLLFSTLFSCVCIQVATNFFNDAIDFDKGADTAKRLGPIRVTASGMLSRNTVLLAAVGFCVLAAIIAIPMIQVRGWPIVVVGAISLFLSYGYTGGPVPLAYRGLGELFVILFFGFVAVCGAHYVQTGIWPPSRLMWILALQSGLFSTVLIAINNFRDIDEDGSTGKRTLAVRFGKTFARVEITILTVVAIGLSLIVAREIDGNLLYLAPLLILAPIIISGVLRNDPGPIYNKFLALSGLQLIVYAIVMTLLFWR